MPPLDFEPSRVREQRRQALLRVPENPVLPLEDVEPKLIDKLVGDMRQPKPGLTDIGELLR